MKNDKLITRKEAARILGVPVRKLGAVGLQPAAVVPNPYYADAAPRKMYNPDEVKLLTGTPAVVKLKPQLYTPRDYTSLFMLRYDCRPDYAISDASEAMHYLNRYRYHHQCNDADKREIAELKQRFVSYLYQSGYCRQTWLIRERQDDEPCLKCRGSGNNPNGDPCLTCNGTGIGLDARMIEHLYFRFEIGSESYIWQMNMDDLFFEVEPTGGHDQQRTENENSTPYYIDTRNLIRYKCLVRWLVYEFENIQKQIIS